MKLIVLALSLSAFLTGAVMAQKSVKTSAAASAAQSTSSNMGIASGTHVSGQLQSTLDVQKAKVGDQVFLKTTQNVKQGGRVVIAKGSQLVGHVTSVQRKVKGNASSSIGVVFDGIRQNGGQMPINSVITSVLQANTAASFGDDDQMGMSSSASSSTSARSSGGGGGLLGGVTNTAGGLVNTTTQTLGNVANTTGQVVGNTTGAVAGSVRGLTITQSTSASAQGGSTLSMTGQNLRLEKGTTFNLGVSSSTSVTSN